MIMFDCLTQPNWIVAELIARDYSRFDFFFELNIINITSTSFNSEFLCVDIRLFLFVIRFKRIGL